ncbi:phosphatase PAP2 family protein [Halobacillus massiliensis]|uniref:phosphatase PAP2 family protein n=1 Tax=Halobacillus massiliensis TaxID=1926286 RepID=UPI0009E45758|nr:phosphatase PAP2 family protein [Halobacillus massiliensis]
MLFSESKASELSKSSILLVLIGLLAVGSGGALFMEIAEDVMEREKFAVDAAAARVASESPAWLTTAMGWITEAGSVTLITIFTIIMFFCLLFFIPLSKWTAVYLAVAMVGISALTKVLKLFFSRERPELLAEYDGTGYSFPSGHTSGASVFYGFMIYVVLISPLKKPLKWVINTCLVLLIFLISFSRVFLNVHYFTDVIGGLTIGLSWLVICIAALEIILWRQRKRRLTHTN